MSNWTPKQQEVIDYNQGNLLVSASAGSGKTSVLIEKIVQLILNGNVHLKNLLVVTFTNSASLEIKQRFAKIILMYYKPKVILSPIKNFNLTNHDNLILLNILSNFDEFDDMNEILNSLSLCGKFYIQSYFYFKLQKLKKRWQDIGNLINENSQFLVDDKVKKEFMQFLMTVINSKSNFAKLSRKNNKVVVESEKVLIPQSLYYSQTEYDNLLFAIIQNKPKKIEIEDYKNFDVAFVQELSTLFGNNLILKE